MSLQLLGTANPPAKLLQQLPGAATHCGVGHTPHCCTHGQYIIVLEGLAVPLAVQVGAQRHVPVHVHLLRVQHLHSADRDKDRFLWHSTWHRCQHCWNTGEGLHRTTASQQLHKHKPLVSWAGWLRMSSLVLPLGRCNPAGLNPLHSKPQTSRAQSIQQPCLPSHPPQNRCLCPWLSLPAPVLTCGASLPKRMTSITMRRKLGLNMLLRWMKIVLRSWLAHSSLPVAGYTQQTTAQHNPSNCPHTGHSS